MNRKAHAPDETGSRDEDSAARVVEPDADRAYEAQLSEPPPSTVPSSSESPMSRRIPGVPSSRGWPSGVRALHLPRESSAGAASSEPPSSGLRLAALATPLLRSDLGPGHWIREGSVSLAFAGKDAGLCRVIRLNPMVAWFVPEPENEYVAGDAVEVVLNTAEREIGPLVGRVVSAPPAAEGAVLGIAFDDMPYLHGRRILDTLADLAARGKAHLARRAPIAREMLTDPARIRAVLRALAGTGARSWVRGWPPEATPHLLRLREDDKLLWSLTGKWGEAPFVVDLVGYNSLFRIHIQEVQVTGEHAETPIPASIERVRSRHQRRGAAAEGVEITLRHPLWAGIPVLTRALRDVSFGGLSFLTDANADMLFAGLPLPLIELRREGHPSLSLRGEVRAVTRVGGQDLVGLRVEPHSSGDLPRWNALVAEMLYPTTSNGTEWSEMVWDLYRSSGYFNLSGKQPDAFDTLRRDFISVENRGAKAPEIFHHVVFPSTRGVEATMSLAKTYRGTWWGHQLAKRAGAPPGGQIDARKILRDIYFRGMEYPQTDPSSRWMMGLIEASVVWMHQSHIVFAEKHLSAGEALNLPFRLYEGLTEGGGPVHPEVSVSPASPEDLSRILAVIQATRSNAYVEALDFVADRVELGQVTRDWERANLGRERHFLVAKASGRAVAAAVIETGETGTSLFHLFDSVRTFALAAGGEGAFTTLIEQARRWYRDRRKESFVYLCEHEDCAHADSIGMKNLGDGFLWIISAKLIPEFLEHIFELTQPKRSQ
ncbi:MAG: hypothetical protein ABI193_05510 [Minicystis sp.]